jgi:hypothetical protein
MLNFRSHFVMFAGQLFQPLGEILFSVSILYMTSPLYLDRDNVLAEQCAAFEIF